MQIMEYSISVNIFDSKIQDVSLSQIEKEELKERILMVIGNKSNKNT